MGNIYLFMFIPFFQKIGFINIYIYTSKRDFNEYFLFMYIYSIFSKNISYKLKIIFSFFPLPLCKI